MVPLHKTLCTALWLPVCLPVSLCFDLAHSLTVFPMVVMRFSGIMILLLYCIPIRCLMYYKVILDTKRNVYLELREQGIAVLVAFS